MSHFQQSHVSLLLGPMPQIDFISLLLQKRLDHVAECILSYLDPKSLCVAELVSKKWKQVILEGRLWKRLIEHRVMTYYLWKGVCVRRGWIKYLFKPVPVEQQPEDEFYRRLFPRILQEIQSIQTNWLYGPCDIQKINCSCEIKGVVCVHFDHKKIVTGLPDNTIKVWDRNTLQCVQVLTGHTASVSCLQVDERVIISGSADSTVRVWDVSTGAVLNTLIHHSGDVDYLKFKNGLMVTASSDNSIAVWDMTSPTEINLLHVLVDDQLVSRAVDFDEKYLVSGCFDGYIKVWNTSSCRFVRTLDRHNGSVTSLQYRDTLVVTGGADRTVRILDIGTGACLRILRGHEEIITCMRFDNKRIVSGDNCGKINVWDLSAAFDLRAPAGALCLGQLSKDYSRVLMLEFDEFQIVGSFDDDTIAIWNFLDSTPSDTPGLGF